MESKYSGRLHVLPVRHKEDSQRINVGLHDLYLSAYQRFLFGRRSNDRVAVCGRLRRGSFRPPAILRFGVIEVDVRSGELRRQGARIKLQEQPFHVLTVLLQRPGEVVTREELRNQNWPADTFVDFDNSLNTAINKLREALGDSADSPRFIETLPRRGYRFIAPVTSVDGTTRGTPAGMGVATPTRGRKIAVTVAVVVLAAGAIGGLLWHSRRGRVLTGKD